MRRQAERLTHCGSSPCDSSGITNSVSESCRSGDGAARNGSEHGTSSAVHLSPLSLKAHRPFRRALGPWPERGGSGPPRHQVRSRDEVPTRVDPRTGEGGRTPLPGHPAGQRLLFRLPRGCPPPSGAGPGRHSQEECGNGWVVVSAGSLQNHRRLLLIACGSRTSLPAGSAPPVCVPRTPHCHRNGAWPATARRCGAASQHLARPGAQCPRLGEQNTPGGSSGFSLPLLCAKPAPVTSNGVANLILWRSKEFLAALPVRPPRIYVPLAPCHVTFIGHLGSVECHAHGCAVSPPLRASRACQSSAHPHVNGGRTPCVSHV